MSLLTRLHDCLSRKDCPYTQFVKYVGTGVIAVAVDSIIFYLMAWLVLPCLKSGDPVVSMLELLGFSIQTVDPDTLIRNFWIIKVCCFVAANIAVYILNVLYVFESGRHKRHHEVMLFFLISLGVFLIGTWIGSILIGQFGWHITYTYIVMLTVSVLANYSLRKFVVFKR